MNNEHPVGNYADEACVVEHFRSEGIHIAIYRWSETATELCPENRDRINSIRQIYEEIDEDKYQDQQVLRFVSVLLGALSSDNDRHMLISLQATKCKREKA